jgi:hypothetical protein
MEEEYSSRDIMIGIILSGCAILILGILALFVPALTKIINIPLPVNDKVKALIIAGVGIALMAYGYFSG